MKPCAQPGCHLLIQRGTHCSKHAKAKRKAHDDRRGSSAERGYNYRWQKARAAYLSLHPLCVMCLEAGRTTAATVVDHKTPHKGDDTLFWSESNWQSLCKQCHDSTKQSIEKGGIVQGCQSDGTPLDPGHHWNK